MKKRNKKAYVGITTYRLQNSLLSKKALTVTLRQTQDVLILIISNESNILLKFVLSSEEFNKKIQI